jgi:gas vesicle protein
MIIMTKNSKIAVVAGLGAIAGGVAGYYLNSDKGREQRQKATETVKDQSAKAASYVGDIANKAKTVASDLASKAQQVMTTAANKADKVKENVTDGVQDLKNKADRPYSSGYANANS